ncbi:unnamed protein product [Calypogeia fissa]
MSRESGSSQLKIAGRSSTPAKGETHQLARFPNGGTENGKPESLVSERRRVVVAVRVPTSCYRRRSTVETVSVAVPPVNGVTPAFTAIDSGSAVGTLGLGLASFEDWARYL